MPNRAVSALHKISGVATLCMCKSIFVYTSKTEQYAMLSVETFLRLTSIMISQVVIDWNLGTRPTKKSPAGEKPYRF